MIQAHVIVGGYSWQLSALIIYFWMVEEFGESYSSLTLFPQQFQQCFNMECMSLTLMHTCFCDSCFQCSFCWCLILSRLITIVLLDWLHDDHDSWYLRWGVDIIGTDIELTMGVGYSNFYCFPLLLSCLLTKCMSMLHFVLNVVHFWMWTGDIITSEVNSKADSIAETKAIFKCDPSNLDSGESCTFVLLGITYYDSSVI